MKNAILHQLDLIITNAGESVRSKAKAARALFMRRSLITAFTTAEMNGIREAGARDVIQTKTENKYLTTAMAKYATTNLDGQIIEDNLTNCLLFLYPKGSVGPVLMNDLENMLFRTAQNLILIRYVNSACRPEGYIQFVDGLKELIVERLGAYFGYKGMSKLKGVCLEVLRARYDPDYLRFLMLEIIELKDFEGLPWIRFASSLLKDPDELMAQVTEAEDPYELLWQWIELSQPGHPLRSFSQAMDLIALINFAQTCSFPEKALDIHTKLARFDWVEVGLPEFGRLVRRPGFRQRDQKSQTLPGVRPRKRERRPHLRLRNQKGSNGELASATTSATPPSWITSYSDSSTSSRSAPISLSF